MIGGMIGAVLVMLLFDWGLIFLSSLVGASLISQAIPLERPFGVVLFIGSFFVGIVIQMGMIRAQKPKPRIQH
jgi:hypothetical protein